LQTLLDQAMDTDAFKAKAASLAPLQAAFVKAFNTTAIPPLSGPTRFQPDRDSAP
jgi:hypothetical protein